MMVKYLNEEQARTCILLNGVYAGIRIETGLTKGALLGTKVHKGHMQYSLDLNLEEE